MDDWPHLHALWQRCTRPAGQGGPAGLARDQQDLLFGITVLLLRLVVTGTVAGVGLILLTAGSTEWELRSADLRMPPAPRPR